MKIAIDWGGYSLLNLGDLAMLQVTLARLKSFYPDASIHVFTTSPSQLTTHCPGANSLLPYGRNLWFSPLIDYAAKIPDSRITQACLNTEWKLRDYAPDIFKLFFEMKLKRYSSDYTKNFEIFMEVINSADLVVASGGGYVNDLFKDHATSVLNTIGFASRLGKPTAMFGQGLGPLRDHQLIAKAKGVLPNVDLIGLREKRASTLLLKTLAVPPDRVYVTGDDAIELAYNNRSEQLGDCIGVNLRVASYSSINPSAIQMLQNALSKARKILGTNLIPTPISLHSHSSEIPDSKAINNILENIEGNLAPDEIVDTPLKAIQQIGRCRLVITGSYHAGVFALSQGIPVIGLALSEYYKDKFLGLSDQFGAGCEVVYMDSNQLEDKLLNAIQNLWNNADSLKESLLESAVLQMQNGQVAYKKFCDSLNT